MAANPWDAMVETYRAWGEPVSSAFARSALEQAVLRPGSDVLDVGAGTGALALQAAAAGHDVLAIDLAAGMVADLTERFAPYAGSSAEVMDALELQRDDATFDASFAVLSVMLFGERIQTALREMVRVTRQGGVVAVVHWAEVVPIMALLSSAVDRLPDVTTPASEVARLGHLRAEEVEKELSAAGCVDVTSTLLEVETPIPAPDEAFATLGPMFATHPALQMLSEDQRGRLGPLYADELRAAISEGRTRGRAHLALGRVP